MDKSPVGNKGKMAVKAVGDKVSHLIDILVIPLLIHVLEDDSRSQ